MKSILITEGRVIDCVQNLDSVMDILISNGKITKLEPKITNFPSDTIIISAKKKKLPECLFKSKEFFPIHPMPDNLAQALS